MQHDDNDETGVPGGTTDQPNGGATLPNSESEENGFSPWYQNQPKDECISRIRHVQKLNGLSPAEADMLVDWYEGRKVVSSPK